MKQFIFTILLLSMTLFSYSQNGSIDSTFGNKGHVFYSGSKQEKVTSIAIQNDDKIIVAETNLGNMSPNVRIARLNSGGSLDPSFRTFQYVEKAFTTFNVTKVLIQPDNKILILGGRSKYSKGLYEHRPVLIRLNEDGSIDTTFQQQGFDYTVVPDGKAQPILLDLKLQSNGKMVVLLSTDYYITRSIYRLDPDGKFDSSFGTNGWIFTESDELSVIDIDAQDRIAGFAYSWEPKGYILSRFLLDGKIDSGFGLNGIVTIKLDSFSSFPSPQSIKILPDGKMLLVSTKTDRLQLPLRTNFYLYLTKCNSNGTLDNSFGNMGHVIYSDTSRGWIYFYFTGLAVNSSEQIIVSFYNDLSPASYLVQFNSNGSFDSSFGLDGIANYGPVINTMALQNNGKIIVGGGYYNGAAFVARIDDSEHLQNTVSQSGKLSSSSLPFVSLYPNPAQSTIHIVGLNPSVLSRLSIIDNTGKLIQEQKAMGDKTFSMNIAGLTSGIYFLQVRENNQTKTIKFIKR